MDVFELADSLTDKNIENVIAYWEGEDKKSLETYKSLVRLGDRPALAMATTLENKRKQISAAEIYANPHFN